jgi:hypothetical protein
MLLRGHLEGGFEGGDHWQTCAFPIIVLGILWLHSCFANGGSSQSELMAGAPGFSQFFLWQDEFGNRHTHGQWCQQADFPNKQEISLHGMQYMPLVCEKALPGMFYMPLV